jgi:hypothetical protein
MERVVSSNANSVFELPVTTGEGSTMVDGRMNLVASYANDGVTASADRVARANAEKKKPVLAARDRASMARHGVCGANLLSYRACYGRRIACKRLQVQGSYPDAELLLQIESKMRYYPACFTEHCLLCCGSHQDDIGRIQCGVHAGQMPRCDCATAADTLVGLRRMAA